MVTLPAQYFLTDLQVVGVPCRPVQEVGRLNKLGPEEVLAPVDLEVGRERLRDEVVPLHDLIQDLVALDGRLDVAHEDLEPWPEGPQGIYEGLGMALGFVHVNILHDVTAGS